MITMVLGLMAAHSHLIKSGNKTVAVTDNETGTAYTLKWAPGKLFTKSVVTEALASGINIYERDGMYVRLVGATMTATYWDAPTGGTQITDPWDNVTIGDDVTAVRYKYLWVRSHWLDARHS